MSKCVSSGQLYFVDCLTKLLTDDTSSPDGELLKSFRIDQK